MTKYSKGLIIGRFQPLHKGHIYLIKQGLQLADKLIIGIGSANVIDFDNPFSVEEREEVLKDMISREGLQKNIIKIIRLDDNPSDALWLEQTLKKTGKIDIIIGNNQRVERIVEDAGHMNQRVPFYKRHIYEGKKIRAKMREEGTLQSPIRI